MPSFIFLAAEKPLSSQVIYFKEEKYSVLFLNPNTSAKELTLILVMNLRVVGGAVEVIKGDIFP